MRRNSLLLLLVIASISVVPQRYQQAEAANSTALTVSLNAPSPDLITYWSLVPNPKNGKFQIQIKNLGNADAGASIVVLKLTHIPKRGSRPQELSFTAKVPAIPAGQKADVIIKTGLDLTLDSSCTIADGTNLITESNETNNSLCGPVNS